MAHGALSIGGLTQGAKFATSAAIPSGGTVEKEINISFNDKNSIRFALNSPDFTTAARVIRTINQNLGGKFATAPDSATIDLIIPGNYKRRVVDLIAIIENYRINQDQKAKIVINEKTGTIVAGGHITLNPVAISHGDIAIQVGSEGGKKGSLQFIEKQSTLQDLVNALNAMGTNPDDLISIFQALKSNGALVADLEFI
jgi:flagellar P-ring protein precursor FlgI